MRRLIIIALLTGFACSAESQTTGFKGKRFAVKADLLSGVRFMNLGFDLEYVTSRRSSIVFGINAYQQTPLLYELSLPNRLNITPEPTQSAQATLGVRFYGNKVIPAPRGFYLALDAGAGIERHQFAYRDIIEDTRGKAKKASIFGMISAPGMGYQGMIGSVVMLDFKLAFETHILYDESDFGYNFVGSNLINYRFQRFVFGPSAYLKLGFLLF